MSDSELVTTIRNMVFENEHDARTARIISHYPLSSAMRNWLIKLVNTNGAKHRPELKCN